MASYLVKRLLLMIPTLFGIVVLSFFVMRLAPGDPAAQKFGGVGQATSGIDAERGTAAAEARFRQRFKFDQPLPVQFGYFLQRMWTGDMIFFQTEQPIWEELWSSLQITIALNAVVFVLIYLIAIPTGIWSAAFPDSVSEKTMTVLLFFMYSLPSFWVAELLRLMAASPGWAEWGLTPPIFPIFGLKSQNHDELTAWGRFADYVWHGVLPVACLTYSGLAYISRQMRAGMLEVIRQDYIRTARAKGAGETRVILVHALRNSLFPIITLFASLLPFLVGGSVIIEVIFNIQGMGLKSYEAVLRREYDFVMVTLMISAVLTLIGILVSDLLYVVVNPRVSFDDKR